MSEQKKIDLKEWCQTRDRLIQLLITAADSLDQRHVNICFARIFGNTVSSIGGGMVLVGLALAPMSAGTSLPLLVVTGGVIGCLGNTTSIGSIIFEKVSERKDLETTKKLIDQFNANTETLLSREASLYWNFLNLISPCLSTYNAINTCIKFVQIFDTVSDTVETGGVLFTNALCKAGMSGRIFGKFALHLSLFLNVFGIAVDTVDSALAAKEIKNLRANSVNDSDKPSRKLREFICKFKNLDFEEIENRFVRYNAGICVVNQGRFKARFSVTYLLDRTKITAVATKQFKRKQAMTKEFVIPKVARSVCLKIQVRLLGWKWRTIFKRIIYSPYFKCYKLSSGRIFPRIKEITNRI